MNPPMLAALGALFQVVLIDVALAGDNAVVVGLAVLALAGSLPFIGWFVSIGAGLLGLGAVFLSRFGTRLFSQPRQPLPL